MITKVLALSSPVSAVYARNAWDHDPLWQPRTACIFNTRAFTEARVIMFSGFPNICYGFEGHVI